MRTLVMAVALVAAVVACASPRNEPVPLGPDNQMPQMSPAPTSPVAPVPGATTMDAAVESQPPKPSPSVDAAPKPLAPVDVAPKPPAPVDAGSKPPAPVDMAPTGPAPPPCSGLMGQQCESCGGSYGCDGICQSRAAVNFGKSCDGCGGTFDCNGVCQTTADPRAGQDCDTCGAKFDCGGNCHSPNFIDTVRNVRLANATSDDPMHGQRIACEAGWEFVSCQAKDYHCAVYKNDMKDLSECNCFAAPQVDSTFPLECEIQVTRHRIGCNRIF